MTFTTMKLTGERVLVRGTDVTGRDGETVLDASVWYEAQRHSTVVQAQDEFDAKVEEFFAPLTAAIEQVESATAGAEVDPDTYVVIHEGTEAQQGRDEVRIRLDKDGVVLRLIERGDTDRLVWVNGTLEVAERAETPAQPAPAVEDEAYATAETPEV